MITHIITEANKHEWQVKLKRLGRMYNLIFLVTLVMAFCISILPFRLNWIASASTEPREAVVRIETPDGQGSGFLISPYYILTARHVVEDCGIGSRVSVSFEQAKFPVETGAEVVYYKEYDYAKFSEKNQPQLPDYIEYFENDVAILRLDEGIRQIAPLALGNSDELKTGNVLIMGYGLGDWSEPDGKITNNAYHSNSALYKLDGSMNGGHSGGPIMLLENNVPTKVIGISVGDFSGLFTGFSGKVVTGEKVVLKINQADKVMAAGGYNLRNLQ